MNNTLTKYKSFWICLILTLIIFAVFYQVYSFKFITYWGDDPPYVTENLHIQSGITFETIKWAFTSGCVSNWHPLTWFSYMLDWQLFGLNPAGFHLTNLIFHISNTLLVFLVLKKMTRALWQSAFVAALFALHPLHVESVAWVSERKDVLSTFFWLLTMWAYLRYVKQPNVFRYLLTMLIFALGLMSKPMLVTLPFVLLLLDYWPLNRLNSRRSLLYLIIEKIPLIVMVIASSIVTFIVQKKSGAMVPIKYCDFKVRFANAAISYLQYIIKMIWPTHLTIFYPHPGPNVSILYAIISAGLLLIVTILVLLFAKNHRYLATGWFWYLGTLIPVIGIVQVGLQAYADRYSYITLTGLFIIIAWGVSELFAKFRYKKIVLVHLALLTIAAMSICTWFQVRYWQNGITLFQHTLEVTRDNYIAHSCMAIALYEKGKLKEAVYHCSEAVRIRPDWTGPMSDLAWYLAVSKGTTIYNPDKAVVLALRACELTNYRKPEILDTLAISYAATGDFDKAVETAQKALGLCQSPEQKTLKKEIENRLALYKVGIPYTESKK